MALCLLLLFTKIGLANHRKYYFEYLSKLASNIFEVLSGLPTAVQDIYYLQTATLKSSVLNPSRKAW